MKNLILKRTMLNPVLNVIQGNKTIKVSGRYLYEERDAIFNLFWQLSALLLTLPLITTLLLIWFKIK